MDALAKKEYKRKYYLKNKDMLLLQSKEKYLLNKRKILLRVKEYNLLHKEQKKQYDKIRRSEKKELLYFQVKQNYLKNKLKIDKYRLMWAKDKRKIDPLFKLKKNLRKMLWESVKNKNISSENLVGYSFENLKFHLEKQFDSNMSWDNYGSYWSIDHKIPCSWFKTEEQLIKVGFRLNNLQPLEVNLNKSKGDSYVFDIQKNPLPSGVICL